MTVSLSPVFQDAQLDAQGNPASGHKVFTYAANTSTKTSVFTTLAGTVAHTNPIVLNSRGEPPDPIWLTDAQKHDFVFTTPGDTDPPTSPIRTVMDVSGIGDTVATSQVVSEWVTTGLTPTFISTTSFSLPGNQTAAYHPKRRIRAITAGGTLYGSITTSVFTSLTTVTVVLDSGTLDASLTRVDVGITSAVNTSQPVIVQPGVDVIEVRSFTATTPQDFLITTAMAATYKVYVFLFTQTSLSATASALFARFTRDSGVSYDAGASDYGWRINRSEIDTAFLAFIGNPSSSIQFTTATSGVNTFLSGEVTFEPVRGYISAKLHSVSATGPGLNDCFGQKSSVTSLNFNGIRFFVGSGTFTGKITMLGRR